MALKRPMQAWTVSESDSWSDGGGCCTPSSDSGAEMGLGFLAATRSLPTAEVQDLRARFGQFRAQSFGSWQGHGERSCLDMTVEVWDKDWHSELFGTDTRRNYD